MPKISESTPESNFVQDSRRAADLKINARHFCVQSARARQNPTTDFQSTSDRRVSEPRKIYLFQQQFQIFITRQTSVQNFITSIVFSAKFPPRSSTLVILAHRHNRLTGLFDFVKKSAKSDFGSPKANFIVQGVRLEPGPNHHTYAQLSQLSSRQGFRTFHQLPWPLEGQELCPRQKPALFQIGCIVVSFRPKLAKRSLFVAFSSSSC